MKIELTAYTHTHTYTQFAKNQKQTYRSWKEAQIEIKSTPPTEQVKGFWQGIWEKEVDVEPDTDWHKRLKETYCKEVETKRYRVDKVVFEKVINRTPNNKAPGRDAIVGFWMKKLTELHPDLILTPI